MEYDKMTKAQLIEKLENLSHLGTTVHAKNKQINELKKERNKNLEDYEKRLSELAKELQEKDRLQKQLITPKKHKEELEKVWKDAQEAVDKANVVLKTYEQAMTLINSALAIINENDKYMSEKINK